MNGNPTTYKGIPLAFDPENRLTSYGFSMTAGYRGDGLRAWKETAQGRTYYLYDGIMPVMEYAPSSVGGMPVINTFGAAGLASRSGEPGTQGGQATSFYAFDPQGSVWQVVAKNPQTGLPPIVSQPQTYTAHGAPLSSASAPFGYGARWGYYVDPETGLQLLTHRYYDPQTGRFLTRDPISYRGGINLYAYTKNNPASRIDPLGLDDADYPITGGSPSPNYWYWSHNESDDNQVPPRSYPPSISLPENNTLLLVTSKEEAWQAQYRKFGRDIKYSDPYAGAYRHCVAACLLARRTGPFAYLGVWIWDTLSENPEIETSRSDMEGEQFGLQCSGGDDLCENECLKKYPHY